LDINAIQQRATDFPHVMFHLIGRAIAIASGVSPVTAGAGIEGSDEHKVGWKGGATERAGDRDDSIFEWLSHHFQGASIEFGKFIQEEHSIVCHGDFTWRWWAATSDQSSVADRVMRRAKGAFGHQWLPIEQSSKHTVDARRLNRFACSKLWKNGG
jgi:hypothetical protein